MYWKIIQQIILTDKISSGKQKTLLLIKIHRSPMKKKSNIE